MVGLSLVGKSMMLDFVRKNEPRGDKIQYEQIWNSSNQPNFNLIPTTNLLYIVEGIEMIVELRSGESVPALSGDAIKLYYPETQSVSDISQKVITIDTTNRGLDALITMCRPDSLKILDLTDFTTANILFGLIPLNYVLLDASLDDTKKQILIQKEASFTFSGTGRIIFRAKGWKIFKSDW